MHIYIYIGSAALGLNEQYGGCRIEILTNQPALMGLKRCVCLGFRV
jgi:hypothetical protein